MGRGSIDRAANRLGRERMKVQAEQIATVDPAHELLPGSNPPAKPELEGANHLLQRSARGVEDNPGTQVNYPEACFLRGCRCLFPSRAHAGEKVVSRRAVLSKLLVSVRPVVSDRRR